MDSNQLIRYSEAEKAVIKKTFKDDLTLYALRNHFWQLELSAGEKELLDFKEDQLLIIKKVMLPDIERNVPLGQQVDETNDPLLEQIALMSPASALTVIDANELRVQYLRQQFQKVVTGHLELKQEDISLKDLKSKKGVDQDEIRHVNMLAYKSIKNYIDGRIFELKHFANPPEELTPEQQKEKQKKDSTQ